MTSSVRIFVVILVAAVGCNQADLKTGKTEQGVNSSIIERSEIQHTGIEHRLFPDGPVLGYEYLLPCSDMPEAIKVVMPPWLAQFVGKSSEQATEFLNHRWSKIESPVLIELRELLGEFTPRSIMVSDSDFFLVIFRETLGDALYIPEPVGDDVAFELSNSIVESNQCLEEFLRHFAGLRESIPGCSGSFIYDKRENFSDKFDPYNPDQKPWEEATVLFHGSTGDAVLINSKGKIVWNAFAAAKIKRLADSFDDFIRYYVEYRKGSWPLDSYGPN